MSSPSDRVYSSSHEWHKTEGETVTLGITRFAVDQLTDVTFVGMKPAGTKIRAGETVGEVESVKTTSDIYSAVGGEIVAVNDRLSEDPSLVNSDPYESGWLVKIRVEDKGTLGECVDAAAYDQQYGQ